MRGERYTMKCKRPFRLRDAIFLAGIPLVLLSIWIGLSVRNFYLGTTRYASTQGLKYYAQKVIKEDLPEVLSYNERTAVHPPEKSSDSLLIDVNLNELERLSDNLPRSGEERIDALVNNRPAKLSLRGSGTDHWLGKPKSFSLKFLKDNLFLGHRKWNLTATTIMQQYVAYELGYYLGLLGPSARPIHVFLNRRYYSPMHLIEAIDEQFLLNRNRMTGVLIKGENFYQTKRDIPESERSLFLNSYSWEYEGDEPLINEARDIMQKVAELVLQYSDNAQSELEGYFALNEMAYLLALQLLCNDFHMDSWHNQRFYYDPVDGKVHPIWWDTAVRPWTGDPLGGRITCAYKMHRLMMRLLQNPFFYKRVCEIVQTAFYGAEFEELVARIDEREQDFDEVMLLARDKNQLNANVANTVVRNAQLLRQRLNYVSLNYSALLQGMTIHLLIRNLSWGAAVFQGFKSDEKLAEPYIWADMNFNGKIDAADRRIALIGDPLGQGAWLYRLEEVELLYSGCRFSGYPRDVSAGIEPETLCYSYLMHGVEDVTSIQAESVVQSEDEAVMIENVPYDGIIPATSTIHPWSFKKETGRQIEFAGDVILTNTVIVEG